MKTETRIEDGESVKYYEDPDGDMVSNPCHTCGYGRKHHYPTLTFKEGWQKGCPQYR